VTERQNANLVKLLLTAGRNSYESHGRWVAVNGYMIGVLNKDCLDLSSKDSHIAFDIPVVVARDTKWLTNNLLENRASGAPVVAPTTPSLEERRRRNNISTGLISSHTSATMPSTSETGVSSSQPTAAPPTVSTRRLSTTPSTRPVLQTPETGIFILS
jgi:hypothetical protein